MLATNAEASTATSTPSTEAPAPAAEVAKTLQADQNPQPQTAEQVVAAETAKTETAPAKITAEDRKGYLSAQKALRKAQAEQKKAKAMNDKATKVEKALASSPWEAIKEFGADPNKFYEDLTKSRIDAVVDANKDPQKKLIEETIKPYIDEIKQSHEAQVQQEYANRAAQIISSSYLPHISDDHVGLLSAFQGDKNKAAIYVFNECARAHAESNGEKVWDPKEAVIALDTYHANEIKKQFGKLFGTTKNETTPAPQTTPAKAPEPEKKASPTLTAKGTPMSLADKVEAFKQGSVTNTQTYLTNSNTKLDTFKKKYGLT
jgi:hypothetical protein